MLVDGESAKKPSPTSFIATPATYYSTAKARYLGTKYKENLDRLAERIVRNPKTAPLQFANNISSVGGIGFFTHSATETPDERYLEVVLATPESFETKGEHSDKVHQLFSRYGTELLNIMAGDSVIFQDQELRGYGLNLTWRNLGAEAGASRVSLARAIIYLKKEKVADFLRHGLNQNDLLSDAVIFAVEDNGPLELVSYQPKAIKADFRPAIREANLAPTAAKPASAGANRREATKKIEPKIENLKKDAPGSQRNADAAATAVPGTPEKKEPPAAKKDMPEVSQPTQAHGASDQQAQPIDPGSTAETVALHGNETAAPALQPNSLENVTDGTIADSGAGQTSIVATAPATTKREAEPTTKASQPSSMVVTSQRSNTPMLEDKPLKTDKASAAPQKTPVSSSAGGEKTVARSSSTASKVGDLKSGIEGKPAPAPLPTGSSPRASEPVAMPRLPLKDKESPPYAPDIASTTVPPESVVKTSETKPVASAPEQATEIENAHPPVPTASATTPRLASEQSVRAAPQAVVTPAADDTKDNALAEPSTRPSLAAPSNAASLSAGVAEKQPALASDRGSAAPAPSLPDNAAGKPAIEQLALLKKPEQPEGVVKKPLAQPIPRPLEGFIIQIAFSDKDKATLWAEKMERRGYAVSITEAGTTGALRVRLGNFAAREEAERQLRNFKREGMNGIVINLPQAFRPVARSSVP